MDDLFTELGLALVAGALAPLGLVRGWDFVRSLIT